MALDLISAPSLYIDNRDVGFIDVLVEIENAMLEACFWKVRAQEVKDQEFTESALEVVAAIDGFPAVSIVSSATVVDRLT